VTRATIRNRNTRPKTSSPRFPSIRAPSTLTVPPMNRYTKAITTAEPMLARIPKRTDAAMIVRKNARK